MPKRAREVEKDDGDYMTFGSARAGAGDPDPDPGPGGPSSFCETFRWCKRFWGVLDAFQSQLAPLSVRLRCQTCEWKRLGPALGGRALSH